MKSSWRRAGALPGQRQPPVCAQGDTVAELAAFPVERPLHPCHVLLGGADQAKIADLERNEVERGKSTGGFDIDEIHQDQVVAVALVAADSFVVVEEIAAAVKNEATAKNLDPLRVMRGMAVDDGDAGPLDQGVRECLVLGGEGDFRDPGTGLQDGIQRIGPCSKASDGNRPAARRFRYLCP